MREPIFYVVTHSTVVSSNFPVSISGIVVCTAMLVWFYRIVSESLSIKA